MASQSLELDLVHPDDREHFSANERRDFSRGRAHEFEARMLRHDGSISLVSVPVKSS